MAVVRFEPFRELAALQNEMGRWMTQLGGMTSSHGNGESQQWLPAVDVWESDTHLVLSFDLPGVAEDDINVELDDNVLTVTGRRERSEEQAGDRFYRYERRFGTFSRSVTLPAGSNEDAIEAKYANGVLEIRVPKPEEQKPKRIEVAGTKGAIEGKSKRA